MSSEEKHDYCSQCCAWCLRNCLCLDTEEPKKYVGIRYELVPQPKSDFHRTFVHPQGKAENPVLLPRDMQNLLQHSSRRQSQFTVTQQPTNVRNSQRNQSGDRFDSSSSISDGTPSPSLITLSSKLSMEAKEDTIDISQSPTGTFSSAYRRSQRMSYSSNRHSPSSHSIPKDSSADEKEEMMMTHRNSKEGSASAVENVPSLELSLYYNIHSKCLSTYLHCARNLPPKSSKYYAFLLHLTTEKADTLEMKVMGENPSPLLSQSFEISDVPQDEVRNHQLMVRVHDGSTAGKLLCGATIPLEGVDLFGMVSTVQLDTNAETLRGEILLSLTYNHEAKALQGILLKLTNSVLKSDKTGLPDFYVKINLVYKGKQMKQWKSSTKQFSFTTIFNEPFQFDLRHIDIQQVVLEVCVMSYDRFSRDDEIGRVLIGDGVDHTTGNQHWRQIIAQPQNHISHWHTYSPITFK